MPGRAIRASFSPRCASSAARTSATSPLPLWRGSIRATRKKRVPPDALDDAGSLDGRCLLLLERGDPKFAPALAPAFGYRRVNCGMQLAEALHRCAAAALPQVVWALGRVGHKLAVGPLLELLKSEDAPVSSAAALALARMGERKAVDYCLGEARTASSAISPLGVAGGREDHSPCWAELARGGSPEGLTALACWAIPNALRCCYRAWSSPKPPWRQPPRSNVSPAPAFSKPCSFPTK